MEKKMSYDIYKILLKIFICLVWVSTLQQVFSQENWAPTSTGSNVPSSRGYHTAVWTGVTNKMIIWGGNDFAAVNTGGIYDPLLDSWTVTSTGANCPTARWYHTAVWTGTEMIVWGGLNSSPNTVYNTGGIYDPVLNTWTATSTSSAPAPRSYHTAVWTGSKMIVWGGYNSVTGTNYYNAGGVYDPVTDTWNAMTTTNAPEGRKYHTAIWTGSKMIIWGGMDSIGTVLNTGGIYDPLTDTWTPTSVAANVPSARRFHTAVWTGSKMIVWGGSPGGINYNTGGIYDPVSDTWQATSTTGAAAARYGQTAVWTGSRMIVWGGVAGNLTYLNTGGIYDPVTDAWALTTTVNAATVRDNHTAVITTSSMIVWGGYGGGGGSPVYLNTGGIYTNPSVIGITSISTVIPERFSLSQNYPNPFNPVTNIEFQLAKSGFVNLTVFDLLGREIETLVNEDLNAGTYNVDWNAVKYPSGAYFYRIRSVGFSETKKMMLVR
ncbi:MAG: T9SS type A sorting domain-containing protein [Ignavibacteria bacterium]